MFDETTKAAWQGISPSPALKERVLAQKAQPTPVIAFPTKTVKRVISAVACVAVALMLLTPAPQVSLTGTGSGVSMAAYTRQMPDQQSMTLTLEVTRGTTLYTQDGWLEQDGTTALWHLPAEGEYTLTAVNGRRTTEFCVEVTVTEDGRSVKVK